MPKNCLCTTSAALTGDVNKSEKKQIIRESVISKNFTFFGKILKKMSQPIVRGTFELDCLAAIYTFVRKVTTSPQRLLPKCDVFHPIPTLELKFEPQIGL